jgi:RecG-like helicase
MSKVNFKKVIDGLIRSYKSEKLYSTSKKKLVHFNKNASLSKNQKIGISNKLNGSIKKNKSILKIINAKQELKEKDEEVTKSKVIKLTNLSKTTVYSYWDFNLINIDDLLIEINSKDYGN